MDLCELGEGSYLRSGQAYFVVTGAAHIEWPNGALILASATLLSYRATSRSPARNTRCGKLARFFSFVISETLFFVRR